MIKNSNIHIKFKATRDLHSLLLKIAEKERLSLSSLVVCLVYSGLSNLQKDYERQIECYNFEKEVEKNERFN